MQTAKLPENQATALQDASAGGVLPKGVRRPAVSARASNNTIKALQRRGLLRYDERAGAYVPTDVGEELLGLEPPAPTHRLAQRVSCPKCGAAVGQPCSFMMPPHDEAPNEHTARYALASAVFSTSPAAG